MVSIKNDALSSIGFLFNYFYNTHENWLVRNQIRIDKEENSIKAEKKVSSAEKKKNILATLVSYPETGIDVEV